jgi:small subunit ribosomal protein S1
MRAGEVITAEVVRIDQNFVVVNAGLKSESFIPVEEFRNDRGEVEVKPGDFVSVAIEALKTATARPACRATRPSASPPGTTSRRRWTKARPGEGRHHRQGEGRPDRHDQRHPRLPARVRWSTCVRSRTPRPTRTRNSNSRSSSSTASATTSSCRAAPCSRPDRRREREKLLENLQGRRGRQGHRQEHHRLRRVRRPRRHRRPAAHHRPGLAPRQASLGSAVGGRRGQAKVLKFDQEKNRVSLGLKQLGEDPWVGMSRRYPQGTRLFGKVTNLTDYGAFVEVEQGIEGLVHVSEMDWTNKNVHPSKVVQLGDEVEVMILEIDEDRRRISLGMKQCMPNPWDEFSMNHKKGDKVRGQIKSITDFGVFIGLPGGIDGLVHLSDLSWNGRRGGRAQLQEGRRGRGRGAGDRRRARAHLARHQAAGGRSLHQLHRHPRQEQRRQGHGEVASTPRARWSAVRRGRGLPARLGGLPRPRRGLRTHLKEGDVGRRR